MGILALEDRIAAWTHPPMLEEKGASVAGNGERNVVIAVFREKSKLERAVAKDDTVAATAEEVADEAIVVTKHSDGALTISRSHHSVGRSLATLTAKLMIALPLGFYGVLAFTGAGVEITAASRHRDEPTEVGDTDLKVLVEQMEPGWSAVIATYPDKYLDRAVAAYRKLGALMVWHALESQVEAAVRENPIDG